MLDRESVTAADVRRALGQLLVAATPELIEFLGTAADTAEHSADPYCDKLSELDDDTRRYLADPDPEVRVCAALAPNLADDATATDIIVTALDNGVTNPELYRLATLITLAIARVGDVARIAAPARAIIRDAEWTGFHDTWGPLLLAAFRTPHHDGTALSDVQRDILAAVVANRGSGTTRSATRRWCSARPVSRSTGKPAPA
ncbi:MAG TPA: hypothetical protein VGG05_16480 [Pseudonocardiaceae bacterium]|jgi:hypothetical protein